MPQAAIADLAAPCPKCNTDMALASVLPHPVAPQLARHTYLCAKCNQTKTYILPHDDAASNPVTSRPNSDEGRDRRGDERNSLDAPATIYDKDGNFLLPCIVRDLSKSGGRIELFKEAVLPQFFFVSLLPDGGGRRLCSKVWQLTLIAGVRFVEKQTI